MTSSGKLLTFGQGENGLLGDGGSSPKKLPQQVPSLKDEHIGQVPVTFYYSVYSVQPHNFIQLLFSLIVLSFRLLVGETTPLRYQAMETVFILGELVTLENLGSVLVPQKALQTSSIVYEMLDSKK